MKDKVNYIQDEFVNDFLRQHEALVPVVDELRQRLNEVIASHQLTANGVVAVLAELSAAYVQRLQSVFDNPEDKEIVTNMFLDNFHTLLAAYDLADKRQEERKTWN